MNHRSLTNLAALSLLFLIVVESFTQAEPPAHEYPQPPAWTADQVLYEVNLRQFSPAGNVEGLRDQLPRLKELGVGILWVMPVNPIGEKGRSGKLGSPYAVRDFKGFNPEFGTIQQFKMMIDEAHRRGLYVILDWLANHTALDHPWITQHPSWYKHDGTGQLVHPQPTWTDVAALNFDSAPMRQEMIESMAYWIQQAGIDGFRCDSAEFVPQDFWQQARDSLRKIKPIFLLGEGVAPRLTTYGFDASYAWNLTTNTEQIFKATKTVTDLVSYIDADQRDLVGGGFRLNFTSNHDKNAWEGTTRELLGDGVPAFTVLTFTLAGMPLIYNGQEARVEHRLSFFDHDPIQWREDPMAGLYRSLADLKHNHQALWAGRQNAPVQVMEKSTTASVLSFKREVTDDRITVMLNLSSHPQRVPAPPGVAALKLAIGEAISPDRAGNLALAPWSYHVWTE